jgi:hypothetical protein
MRSIHLSDVRVKHDDAINSIDVTRKLNFYLTRENKHLSVRYRCKFNQELIPYQAIKFKAEQQDKYKLYQK